MKLFKIKDLFILLVVALTIYTPMELTRIILKWGFDYGDFLFWIFGTGGMIAEIFFIWIGYLCTVGLLIFCFKEFEK